MGASNTTPLDNISPEEIANYVSKLGIAYEGYCEMITSNAVCGATLACCMESPEVIKSLFDHIGVSSLHQIVLTSHIKILTKRLSLTPDPKNDRKTIYNEIDVGDRITMSPRMIMSKIFEIHGISVDPSNIDSSIRILKESIGCTLGVGTTKYDCFISYRVESDADIAEKIYLYLKSEGVHAFLDKYSLTHGEKWKDGFLTGLRNSRCFVPLISSAALKRTRDPYQDHTFDNLLLEFETALKILESSDKNNKYICPLLVGEISSVSILTKFCDFNSSLYPDTIHAVERAAATTTTTPAQISEEQTQPAGTISKFLPDSYCVISSVKVQQLLPSNSNSLQVSLTVCLFRYLDGGYLSFDTQEQLQDPIHSRLFISAPISNPDLSSQQADVIQASSIDFNSCDNNFQMTGYITFEITEDSVSSLLFTDMVEFEFGDTGSRTLLHIPDSQYPSSSCCDESSPKCEMGHVMIISKFSAFGYGEGYLCNSCKRAMKSQERWICLLCIYDLCFTCCKPSVKTGADMGSDVIAFAGRCTKGHDLLKINRYPRYYMSPGMIVCDDCRGHDIIQRFGDAYHCRQCSYDLCIPCLQNKVNNLTRVPLPRCGMGHVMIVSSYRAEGYSYGYRCNTCSKHSFGDRWVCITCRDDYCYSCQSFQVVPIVCDAGHYLDKIFKLPSSAYGDNTGTVTAASCITCCTLASDVLVRDGDTYHCKQCRVFLCVPCSQTLLNKNVLT